VGTKGKPFELIDSGYVLEQSLINLKVAIEENGALITNDPLPTVMADGMQLVQLFQNLIGNAIKFRSRETPHIHVSSELKEDKWIFSLRDNGLGIESQYGERIFNIFQRLHGRDYPGTGIGLAICKRIIEHHGGRIWVESDPGKGSIFYFTIPLRGGEKFDCGSNR
jgi:light-regulated signal transduction histidine kinase (bacteriophytochrome)